MKKRKNILMIILAVLIIARMVLVLLENKKIADTTPVGTVVGKMEVVQDINPDATLAKTPDEAVTTQNSSDKNGLCQSMRERFQNLNDVKKIEKTSVRFVNIHKKIDGIVYRTRFFYKDSSENEVPTYLLYREDQNEEEHLIEKSPYKKGPEYLKIEKAIGTIIYTEEGVNIGVEQDLFLHYENKVLKDLQGVSPLPEEKDFIECRF